jgi:DNA-binding MarR family transcriptional regulator
MSSPQETLFRHLGAVCSESRRSFDRRAGMGQAQRQLLALLHEQGEVRHAELQQQLGIDGAAVTRLVKRLESEGMVARRLDPDDNRFTLASLTRPGEALVAELRAAHRALQDRLLAGVDQRDQETVVRVLEQLRLNIRGLGPDVEPDAPQRERTRR